MTGVAAQGAMLVPDMNGDGADEVLVSTEGTGENGAAVWMFDGCRDWLTTAAE